MFLLVLGWLGFAFGLVLMLFALMVSTRASPLTVLGAPAFELGASLFGGGLVLIGLGDLSRRIEVLCHYARLQAYLAQVAEPAEAATAPAGVATSRQRERAEPVLDLGGRSRDGHGPAAPAI